MMKSKIFTITILIGILAAVAVLYLPTLKYEYVWDDYDILKNEPVASGKLPWQEAFKNPVDRLYRPLRTVTYTFDRVFFNTPAAYHRTSVILFLLCCFSLYFFIMELTRDHFISLSTTFIYSLHPVHVENVAWISNRASILDAIFLFITFTLYLLSRKSTNQIRQTFLSFLSWVAYTGALFSKETSLIAPLFLIPIELSFPLNPSDPIIKRCKNAALNAIPFLMISISFFFLRKAILGESGQISSYHGGSLAATIASIFPVFIDYIRITFMPISLCAIYTPKIFTSFLDVHVLSAIAVIVILAIAGIVTIKKLPVLSFSILWFLIALLPVSNLIPIATMKANRFLMLPVLGGCLIVAAAVGAMRKLPLTNQRGYVPATLLIMVIGFSLFINASTFRNVWKNGSSLWSATVQCSPNSFVAFNNLAICLFTEGRVQESIKSLETAARLQPNFPPVRDNLGRLYAREGRYAEAIVQFKFLLSMKPDDISTMAMIVLLYKKSGNMADALPWINRILAHPYLAPENRSKYLEMKDLAIREAESK